MSLFKYMATCCGPQHVQSKVSMRFAALKMLPTTITSSYFSTNRAII